MIQISAIRQ